MHKLLDYISEELAALDSKAAKGKLTMQELQYADTLAHAMKNLLKIEDMGDGYSGNYSNAGRRMRDSDMRGYSREDGDGRSYAGVGRGTYAKRDSMGRYSSDSGYSMATGDMISELRELMDQAPDEMKRQEFKRFIDKLERM